MIPFHDPRDAALLAELRECGLITPATAERIDAALGHPEALTLDQFLLGGREIIDERAWLSWLIRRHGCCRFGPVRRDRAAAVALEGLVEPDFSGRDGPAEPNLPYRISVDGRLVVAVLRPDCRQATTERLKVPGILWAAATLGELQALREDWRRRAPRHHV